MYQRREQPCNTTCTHGVRLGGIFKKLGRDGVGKDGDDGTGSQVGAATGMLRLTNAESLYFPWAFAGHSFSIPLPPFLSLAFPS